MYPKKGKKRKLVISKGSGGKKKLSDCTTIFITKDFFFKIFDQFDSFRQKGETPNCSSKFYLKKPLLVSSTIDCACWSSCNSCRFTQFAK